MINSVSSATPLIATPATDQQIRVREWNKGRQAAIDKKTIDECPWHGGLTEQWWKEGYQNINNPNKITAL